MKRGTVLFHSRFLFTNGEVGKKYLVILNTPDPKTPIPILFCKTTSQSLTRPQGPGCHANRNVYVIDVKSDFFQKKTWVQFYEIFEADYKKLLQQHFEKTVTIEGELKAGTINAIINCIRKSDDVSQYHLSLLK
jgi:hypothetical protein